MTPIARRTLLWLPGALAAANLLRPPGTPAQAAEPASNPFPQGSPRHRTYLVMRKSAPDVEKRLTDWIAIAKREAKTLRASDNPTIARWRRAFDAVGQGDERGLAEAVNLAVNRDIRYLPDWKHGSKDAWYGPIETLKVGGDCEDYALLKGIILNTRGWPGERLHLVAGVLHSGAAHMMLAVKFADGREALLDNLSSDLHPRPYDGWTPKYQIAAREETLFYMPVD